MKSLHNLGFVVLLGALLVSLVGCDSPLGGGVTGSGTIKSESRPVSGITEVLLSTVGTLTIEQTGTESLTVEGDDNIVPLIATTVLNNRLEIGHPAGTQNFTLTKPLTYHLTVKDLSTIAVSSSGSINSPGFKTARLTLDSSGSGQMRLDGLAVEGLTVAISGSGTTTLAGTTPTQTVNISGSGEYSAADLASTGANVTITGSGNATVRVSKALTANVSGSGTVTYIGNPTVQQQMSGSGHINQRTDK